MLSELFFIGRQEKIVEFIGYRKCAGELDYE
jgi:hypothetical protein